MIVLMRVGPGTPDQADGLQTQVEGDKEKPLSLDIHMPYPLRLMS